MSATAYYELYRRSTIGTMLLDSLDTLINEEKIPQQLAVKILGNFDRVIAELLRNELGVAKAKLTFRGDLHTYRFCDDVWTFIIKNVAIKLADISGVEGIDNLSDNEMNVHKFKIVACNSKKSGEA